MYVLVFSLVEEMIQESFRFIIKKVFKTKNIFLGISFLKNSIPF